MCTLLYLAPDVSLHFWCANCNNSVKQDDCWRLAVTEAKRGTSVPQSTVPTELATAKTLIRRTGHEEFHSHCLGYPHSAIHYTLTRDIGTQFHWRFGLPWCQCITIAWLRTGHIPLLVSYLHRIRWQPSPVCPHCAGDDETAHHLPLQHLLRSVPRALLGVGVNICRAPWSRCWLYRHAEIVEDKRVNRLV